jgi:hypothetical protein
MFYVDEEEKYMIAQEKDATKKKSKGKLEK